MQDEPRSNEPDSNEEDEEEVSNPFDHPFFLPILLFAFALWFGYDGWLNEDFNPEYIDFNRYGFGVLLLLGIYFTIQGLREKRDSD